MMILRFLPLATFLFLAASLAAQSAAEAEKAITPELLLGHVKTLSDDAFEGRGPGTPGAAAARDYIIAAMKEYGLAPGGKNGWVQPVPLRKVENDERRLAMMSKDKTTEFEEIEDFVIENARGNGVHEASGEAVFVGFGVQAPEYGWDDYKGLDCKGKVLVMFVGDPLPEDQTLFNGKALTYYGRWTYKLEKAKQMGAVGCLIIHQPEWASYGWIVVQSSWGGRHMETRQANYDGELAFGGWVKWSIAERLTAGTGKTLDELAAAACRADFKPVPLGITVKGSIKTTTTDFDDENIVGVLAGSDEKVKDEWVVFSAHYDHLGKKDGGKPGEDVIYNGAVDNGTGCAGLLGIAKAFGAMKGKHRRSVMFNFVCSEEQGLLGSRYYVENPLVPLTKTVANINIDGLNMWETTKDLQLVGSGQSELEAWLAAALEPDGRVTGPDQEADKGYYYRSDHFNFAKHGVPALYTKTGDIVPGKPENYLKEKKEKYRKVDYHQPSDQFDASWPGTGGAADAKALFRVGLRAADADVWPKWLPSSEFRAVREKMLSGK